MDVSHECHVGATESLAMALKRTGHLGAWTLRRFCPEFRSPFCSRLCSEIRGWSRGMEYLQVPPVAEGVCPPSRVCTLLCQLHVGRSQELLQSQPVLLGRTNC